VRLGELERRVMEILWSRLGELLTARQVGDELPGYAYTTVLTVLDRLEHKGLVRRERGGRAHRYSATASRESYVAGLMRDALGSAADRDAALVHFAETASPADAAVLRRALAKAPHRSSKRTRR
jgi:predicted transcriptional regulator